ncbi:MAG TPA: hypothetical protein VF832_04910 [Longimicrobiales bacterium]
MRQWGAVLAGAVVMMASSYTGLSWGAAAGALLAGGVLGVMAMRSRASGPALVVALAVLFFGVSWLVNIPEAVLFDVVSPAMAPPMLLRGLLVSLVAASAVVWAAGRLRQEPTDSSVALPPLTTWSLLWRLAALVLVFSVCYIGAGMLIYPFVKAYYAGRAMPQPASMLSMQVLRSLAILGAAYPLLRTFASRRDAVLALGVALPVFGVIIPMLPQNPLMPGNIRLVHTLETAPYLALFGVLIAVWFGPPRRVGTAAAPPEAMAA